MEYVIKTGSRIYCDNIHFEHFCQVHRSECELAFFWVAATGERLCSHQSCNHVGVSVNNQSLYKIT